MGIFKYVISALGFLFLLSGCTSLDIKRAEQVQPQGSPFAKGLYKEYLQHSAGEQSQGERGSASEFAHRAMVAAGGKEFLPAPVLRDKFPKETAGRLDDARNRLMAGLEAGARSKAPATAARAQVMFDCWLRDQEFNEGSGNTARCRREFFTAIASTEAVLKREAAAQKKVTRKFVVYFGFNSTRMSADARRTVAEAVAFAKEVGAKKIELSGFADRSGSDQYNLGLSQRRIKAVGASFGSEGLDPELISGKSFGEQRPAVETRDGKSERRNRRVEIVVSS